MNKLSRTLVLVVFFIVSLATPRAIFAQDGQRCFPETGNCIEGRLLQHWEQNGGLPVFGYPLSAAANEVNSDTGQMYLTQWFERNRFELHPEIEAPYDILLGRLGNDRLLQQGRDWQSFPVADPSAAHYFPQTQHALTFETFWSYWSTHGLEFDGQPGIAFAESLALFGYPISEPAMETNLSGDTVLTQWFERARFESHPNNPQPFNVLLGLLGTELRLPQLVCVDFEPPFAVGTQYGAPAGHASGDRIFTVNGIPVSVHDFRFTGGGGTFNVAYIDNAPVPFGSRQSIRTNNINLGFDFSHLGFQPSRIVFDYLDLGGFENVSVNGSPLFTGEITAVPNMIGGVNTVVSSSSVIGGRTGSVVLQGALQHLTVGGQEFWIDNVCASN